MKRPSSTNNKIEIEIERFFDFLSKIWKIDVIWRAKRISEEEER